jgi:hypothetical protein
MRIDDAGEVEDVERRACGERDSTLDRHARALREIKTDDDLPVVCWSWAAAQQGSCRRMAGHELGVTDV